MANPFRVAILTVSDTAASNAQSDKSGPTIRDILLDLSQQGKFEVTRLDIVPDEEDKIKEAIKAWCETEQVDLILTTGGTGFGTRDRTPEAISTLIERPASGLVHLLLSSSIQHTPLAALSRPVAGTIRKTLVVTLPGSPKAVKENLAALLGAGVVDHALDLLRGGSGKSVHEELQKKDRESVASVGSRSQGGHHHHHHHHYHHSQDHQAPTPHTIRSHDPSLPVSGRHRVSPYPLISYEEAISLVLQHTKPLEVVTRPVNAGLPGHVLAEDVLSPQNIPFSVTTNVDGYALNSSFPKGTYNVTTPQAHSVYQPLPPNTIMRINTGAPLPQGTDAVIMVEDTKLVSTNKEESGNEEESQVETLAEVPRGENVRQPGSDVMKGDKVCEVGEVITTQGGEVGTLVFVGKKEVKVFRKPVVALMSTGNELVDLTQQTGESGTQPPDLASENWGGIYDTNRPSLKAALEGQGYEVIDLGIVTDTVDVHVSALKEALNKADIIITTGGTSMGSSDLLKPVIERNLGGTIQFGRVAIKPGKPTTFATIPVPVSESLQQDTQPQTSKCLFALPGNPASALVMFWVFVAPALRKLGGWPQERCLLPRAYAKLDQDMELDPRAEFHRVSVKCTPEGLLACSTGGQRSSRVASLAGANGLVVLPMKTSDRTKLSKGSVCEVILIGELLGQ